VEDRRAERFLERKKEWGGRQERREMLRKEEGIDYS